MIEAAVMVSTLIFVVSLWIIKGHMKYMANLETDVHYDYCKHCEEEVWCMWSTDKEYLKCYQCLREIKVPKELIKELKDHEEALRKYRAKQGGKKR